MEHIARPANSGGTWEPSSEKLFSLRESFWLDFTQKNLIHTLKTFSHICEMLLLPKVFLSNKNIHLLLSKFRQQILHSKYL